jgi:predicted N-formylglutamate amidohydrolase
MKRVLFLSCEHGGNEVPAAYRPWFKGAKAVLGSHRGIDIGALDLFEHLRSLASASVSNRLSRLCIEFNRSEGSEQWFSEYTASLPPHLQEPLIQAYMEYRNGFAESVQQAIHGGHQVVHVSVHSFTPVLDGVERDCDIGLLFDPKHANEKHFCQAWHDGLVRRAPGLRVRMNYPYKGTSDGFTRTLRKHFSPAPYSGIEIEVNQRFAFKDRMHEDIKNVVYASLAELLRDARLDPASRKGRKRA